MEAISRAGLNVTLQHQPDAQAKGNRKSFIGNRLRVGLLSRTAFRQVTIKASWAILR
jgi:hypothetical protein